MYMYVMYVHGAAEFGPREVWRPGDAGEAVHTSDFGGDDGARMYHANIGCCAVSIELPHDFNRQDIFLSLAQQGLSLGTYYLSAKPLFFS